MEFGSSQDYLSIAINLLALTPILAIVFLLSKRHGLGGGPRASIPGVQMFRHTLLLGCLSVGMFSSIALAVCRLVIHDEVYPGAVKVLLTTNSVLSSGQGIIFLAIFGLDKSGLLLARGQKLVPKLGLPSFADATNNFVMISISVVLNSEERKREDLIKSNDVQMKSSSMDESYLDDQSGLDPVKIDALVEMSLKGGGREFAERSV